MTADRNLLFGILAHQMDFVDAESLVETMNRWMLAKSTPLSRLLVNGGHLDQETFELLDRLVDKHLQHHSDDVQASLNAVGAADSLSGLLTQIEDTDLRQSIAALTPDESIMPTMPPPETSTQHSRFRILRPHAKGGIGKVSIAEDTELAREVAIKELRRNQSDNHEAILRFRVEGEITGQLEHPGIVPVYSRGNHTDGRPFFAMRLIQGETLEKAIRRHHANRDRDPAERRLELHQLLGRFIDVCQAIGYAHSRGVLHRDLKPDNIMLGRFGETLVVDWGLAKSGNQWMMASDCDMQPVQPGSGADSVTRMGSVFGTPAYMPPEQAAGELNRMDERSDVYSLGATLYQLLTGDPPYKSKDVVEVLEKIRSGELKRPREVKPDIAPALEAICLKAMSHSPADRYTQPNALAKDIERWLADEPVSAWKDPITVRTWRWIRNHRSLVTGIAAALIVLLICTATAVVLLTASRDREIAARQSAESNLALARNVVDQFFTEVSEEVLLQEPGMQQLRSDLLSRALSFYQGFVDDNQADPALRDQVAAAWYRIGLIREQIDSSDQALEAFRESQTIQAAADHPESPPANRLAFSDTVNAIGRLQQKLGHYQDAAKSFRDALTIREAVVSQHPSTESGVRKIASSLMNLGAALAADGQISAAQKLFQQAQTERAKELAVNGSYELRRDYGMGAHNLGVLAFTFGDDDPVGYLKDAVEAFTAVLAVNPRDFQTEQKLADAHRLLGRVYFEQMDNEKAIASFRSAERLMNPLVIRNPQLIEFRAALASIKIDLAAVQEIDAPANAVTSLRGAIAILDEVIQVIPDVGRHRRDLAIAWMRLGTVQRDSGDAAAAAISFDRSESLLSNLVKEFPDDPTFSQQQAVLRTLRDPS